MKILVLGGTRFFGKEFARQACKEGHEVTVFSRRCPVDGLPLDVKQARGDRTVEVDLVRMSLEIWDVVVDNICYTPQDAQKAIKAFSGRTGLYIFTSSGGIYYALKGSVSPYRENHAELFSQNSELRHLPEHSYNFGKFDAEKIYSDAYREKKFPVVIARFPIIIGPDDPTLRAYSYWLRITDGQPFFAPGAGFSRTYLFSKDAARALGLMINARDIIGQAFNFADAASLSLADFLKISAVIINRELKALTAGFEWLRENGFDFEASPFSSQTDCVMDVSKAVKTLNWQPSETTSWLKETINWCFFKYTGSPPQNYLKRKHELTLAEKWSAVHKLV
ncbi:MAG: NAD-dependent epimerase/dehydratase family protein [Elusimicrobia bacterium]|nr:NAD-dependent epimerase/dehydratase family protein [Elusimicrobiota bacterium]